MNQDQVKERLLRLRNDVPEFSVIFSGKQSKKVHGLYYPDKTEIILHNKNFENDNELMYTAIHEFAHHVHFSTSPVPVSNRPHTTAFRSIFHELLEQAEQLGLYASIFETHPDFTGLTRTIREEFLARNGGIMKELGGLLVKAEALCREHRARFEDYIERVLLIDRRSASSAIRVFSADVDPRIGFDNMKSIASIKDTDTRRQAEADLLAGKSPDRVRAAYTPVGSRQDDDPVEQLFREKERLKRTIDSLQEKLQTIEDRIDSMRSL